MTESPSQHKTPAPDAPQSPVQEIHWEDFRDHLATADKLGHRKWVYAKKPSGIWTQRRTWLSWLLIGGMLPDHSSRSTATRCS